MRSTECSLDSRPFVYVTRTVDLCFIDVLTMFQRQRRSNQEKCCGRMSNRNTLVLQVVVLWTIPDFFQREDKILQWWAFSRLEQYSQRRASGETAASVVESFNRTRQLAPTAQERATDVGTRPIISS